MAPKMGFVSQLGMGSANPVTELYEYQGGDLKLDEQFLDANGMRGTRSHSSERVRKGPGKVSGALDLIPNAAELANLFPRILGAAAAGTTYALAETLPEFFVTLDRSMKVFTYDTCVVSRATFTGEEGQFLKLNLELEGKDEAIGNAGTFPALSLNVATGPFLFSDAVISVGGSNYSFKRFELMIDNVLDTERFLNATRRAAIPTKDRIINVKLSGPYGDNSALYGPALAGVAVNATFTNTEAAVSVLFAMGKVQFPKKSPTLNGREEILLPLEGVARQTESTKELIVTLDSTP